MALKITITDAGRAELINADNTGTGPVEITHVAFTETTFSPSKTLKALPDEIKRLSSIAGEVVADDTISVTAKDEGTDAYTVRGFGLISEYGTLFAVYSQEAPIIEKSGPTTLLLTTDIILADLPTASLTFGDINFSNPPASTSTPGVVRLSNATNSTSQNQAATPRAVKAANDNANTRLTKSQNLADLPSPSQARSNLGLGASATMGTTASRTSTSTATVLQAKAMNDHRQSGDHDGRYVRLTGADLGSNDLKARLTHNNGYFYIGSYSSETYGEGALRVWWNENAKELNMGGATLRSVRVRNSDVTGRKPVTDLDLVGPGSSDTAATVFALQADGRSPTIRDDAHIARPTGTYYGLSAENSPNGNGHYFTSQYSPNYTKFLFVPQGGQNRLFIGGSHNSVWSSPAEAWTDENLKLTVDGVNVGLAGLMTTQGLNLPNGVALRGVTNGLEVTRSGGSVEIGNRNSSYTHYTSSAGKHYFYGEVHSQSGYYGDGSGLKGTASLRATGTTKADVGLSKVPNLDATDANTANTLMTRNSSGDTWARLFRSSYASTNANIAGLYTTQTIGGDYMRPSTPAQVMNAVGATRTIATGSGLSGGGNLSANRTLSVDSSVVRTSRTINAGSGLSGGGNLSANRTLSVDSTVARTSQFSHSARPSGHTWIAGNILIQWGFLSFGNISSGGTHRRNVTFPIAFPNGAWQTMTSLTSGLFIDGSSSVSAENLVPTGFTAVYAYPWNGGNINPSISWIAIGN